jgi:hypothetical protein
MKRITRGVRALRSKGLMEIVEESKNRGLGSMYKDLSLQIQHQGGAHNMGLWPNMIQGLKRPKTGDAAPSCSHTEWSTRLLELGPEPKEAPHRHDSNASKNTLFGRRMREILLVRCKHVGWIRTELAVQLDDDMKLGDEAGLCMSSVVMSSSTSNLSWKGERQPAGPRACIKSTVLTCWLPRWIFSWRSWNLRTRAWG